MNKTFYIFFILCITACCTLGQYVRTDSAAKQKTLPPPDTIKKQRTYKRFGVGMLYYFFPEDLGGGYDIKDIGAMDENIETLTANYDFYSPYAITPPGIEFLYQPSSRNILSVGLRYKQVNYEDSGLYPTTYEHVSFYSFLSYFQFSHRLFKSDIFYPFIGARLRYEYKNFHYDNHGLPSDSIKWDDHNYSNLFMAQFLIGLSLNIAKRVDIEFEGSIDFLGLSIDRVTEHGYKPDLLAVLRYFDYDQTSIQVYPPITGIAFAIKVHYRFDFKKHKK